MQSRLKVRKMLGVGDTAGSKISQLLGHSDHLSFQLPPKLTIWLLFTTILFTCFTMMVNSNVFPIRLSIPLIGITLAIMFTIITTW